MKKSLVLVSAWSFFFGSAAAQNLRLGFPHIAVGNNPIEVRMIVDLTNKGTQTFGGSLAIVSSDGFFMPVTINNQLVDDFYTLAIQPGRVIRLDIRKVGSLETGHIIVWDDDPEGSPEFAPDIAGTLIFQLFSGGTMIDSIGIPASAIRESFFFIGEFTSTANTGLALSNPRDGNVFATIRAITRNGVFVDGRTLLLTAFEQKPFFINQELSIPSGFRGTIEVETELPIFVLALRQESNLQLSALDVTDLLTFYDFTLPLNDGRTLKGEIGIRIGNGLIRGLVKISNLNLIGGIGFLTGLAGGGTAFGTILGGVGNEDLVIQFTSTSLRTTDDFTAAATVRQGAALSQGTMFAFKK